MGENDEIKIVNNDSQSLADNRSEQNPVSFMDDPFGVWENSLERNMGKDTSRRAQEMILKLMLKAQSIWLIEIMKVSLKQNSQEGDKVFDKTRAAVASVVQGVPHQAIYEDQSPAKQAGVQRWLVSTYVSGFLDTARGTDQFDASIRGIAWSFLAKDAKRLLAERGQTIDDKWLFDLMGPLVRANTDSLAIGKELSKFTQGDPQIIHIIHTLSTLENKTL
jgi:hypothetical protein